MRKILILVFSINLIISHVLLPLFNNKKDFLLFSTWSLYGGGKRQFVYDLTWDQGKTFLFRDHRSSSLSSKINLQTLFYWLDQNNFSSIKEVYFPKIQEHCACGEIEIHRIPSSMYGHIILKTKTEATEKIEL